MNTPTLQELTQHRRPTDPVLLVDLFHGLGWCVVGVVALVVCLFTGCPTPKAAQPPHEPWVIYESGWGTRTDCEALSLWIMDQAECRTSGGGDGHLTIVLASYVGATPRRELLLLAAEAQENLPPGCPITIEVQTLEDAIAYEERYIERCRGDIARLKQIHGEEVTP